MFVCVVLLFVLCLFLCLDVAVVCFMLRYCLLFLVVDWIPQAWIRLCCVFVCVVLMVCVVCMLVVVWLDSPFFCGLSLFVLRVFVCLCLCMLFAFVSFYKCYCSLFLVVDCFPRLVFVCVVCCLCCVYVCCCLCCFPRMFLLVL